MMQLVACPHHSSWPLPIIFSFFFFEKLPVSQSTSWINMGDAASPVSIYAFYPFTGKHYLFLCLCTCVTHPHTSLIWCTLAEDMPFACGIHMTRWWQHILSTVHAGCTFCLFLLDWLLLFSSLLSHMKATTSYMASEFSFLSYLPGGKQSYFSPSLSSSVHNHHHHRRKFSWLQYSRPTDGGSKLTGYNW